jgi:hypothetical protein
MVNLWNRIASAFGRPGGQTKKASPTIDKILDEENDSEILIALSQHVQQKVNSGGIESLAQAEKTFHYIYWLEAEINNGGFDQYFFNSAGDHAQDVPGALEEIGAGFTAQLVREAMEVFPGGKAPQDRNERQEMLLNIGGQGDALLNELDSRFYEYHDDLSALMLAFLRQRKDHFR